MITIDKNHLQGTFTVTSGAIVFEDCTAKEVVQVIRGELGLPRHGRPEGSPNKNKKETN